MDEVCLERSDQLRIKAEIDEQNKVHEQMYADLWHQDMLAKAAREEKEAQERHARNRETLDTLQKQKAALEAKRLEAKRLKEEEGRLLVGHSLNVQQNMFIVYLNIVYLFQTGDKFHEGTET